MVVLTIAASENLARGKPSWQSSTYYNANYFYHAYLAVDGNHAPDLYTTVSCSHTTLSDYKSFWAVDLRQLINVRIVQVTNRRDFMRAYFNGCNTRFLITRF